MIKSSLFFLVLLSTCLFGCSSYQYYAKAIMLALANTGHLPGYLLPTQLEITMILPMKKLKTKLPQAWKSADCLCRQASQICLYVTQSRSKT